MKVLVVEDDAEIRELLNNFLTGHEYEVILAGNGKDGSMLIREESFDIILMDMMLPFKSGDDLIRELRDLSDERKNTPVIVLSAKSGMDTRLEVLRMGADDYIIKPFDLDEVLVRIEVVLRRSRVNDEQPKELKCGELTVDVDNNSVVYNDKEIRLTSKELQLLILFLENPKKTFTKANLYEKVWNDVYYSEDNTINVHMSNLRSKLKKATKVEFIETVWGIGYKLKD
ncbi:MAG: response regulator transcription factor [Lachnospiraceae bacterium]|nr:response regulator transcription factor [Lachnospiraceae bacterium]MCR5701704.1 response regulator transcription factor [Lachnospiraceae bacterium]